MKKIPGLIIFILILNLALVGGCSSGISTSPSITTTTPSVGSTIGKLAIDFQLPDLNGQTVSLSEFRGQPVMLNFWATWCGPCRGEMPLLQEAYDKWKEQGLMLLAIDLQENAGQVQQFLTDNNLTLPVLIDDGRVAQAYGITVIPATYFIDKSGVIRQVVRGAFPNVETIEAQLGRIVTN